MLKDKQNEIPQASKDMKSGRAYWWFIYGFFLLHMLIFGSVGFASAYGSQSDFFFNLVFSGFAITIYLVFYIIIFGIDEIKWLFINSIIGVLGIYSQIDWILAMFSKSVEDYPIHFHIIPGIYFVLYTFLLRRALLELLQAKEGGKRTRLVNALFVAISMLFYIGSLLISKGA